MLVPWQLRRGPEYAQSVEKARTASGPQFGANLRELEARVRISPAEATPITDPDHRVLQIFPPGECSLALYVALDHAKHICWLEWVQAVPPEPEFDPWD
jgi:hypothetical protein